MQLQPLINNLKLDWVNSNITDQNFPYKEMPKGEVSIFTISKRMTTAEIEAKMDKQNLRPATIHEMLAWAKDSWNGKDFIIALGSVWLGSGQGRRVAYLGRHGSGRGLGLGWDNPGYAWDGGCRFLAVSKLPLETGAHIALVLGTLEAFGKVEVEHAEMGQPIINSKTKLLEVLANPAGKVIAVDLDGTICEGEFWGEGEPVPKQAMIDTMMEWYKKRAVIIIYTARQPKYYAATHGWLVKHHVPFHGIVMQMKPGADVYIDDKALNVEDLV